MADQQNLSALAYWDAVTTAQVDGKGRRKRLVQEVAAEFWCQPLSGDADYHRPWHGFLPAPQDPSRYIPASIHRMRMRVRGSRAHFIVNINPSDGSYVCSLQDVELCASAEEASTMLNAAWPAIAGFTSHVGCPERITQATAPWFVERIREAVQQARTDEGQRTTRKVSQRDVFDSIGAKLGYATLEGFQQSCLKKLRRLGYRWPEAFS